MMLMAATVTARSDNSLSNFLGLGSMDSYFMNLEAKQANDMQTNEVQANEMKANEVNNISYNFYDGYSGDSSDSEYDSSDMESSSDSDSEAEN